MRGDDLKRHEELTRQLGHVLWLGGMSGVGKTTGARKIARRYDLRLYALDSYTYAHAQRTSPDRQPALDSYSTLSVDELWVNPEPEAIVERFVAAAGERLELVVEDLLALPTDAPVIVDGPHLLPSLVAPLVSSPAQALYLVADPALQSELVAKRGSTVWQQASDPERARANRLRRDELLAEQVRHEAALHGLTVVKIGHPAETEAAMEQHFQPALQSWLAGGDRGDVEARRRDENDARLLQWRLHAESLPAAVASEVEAAEVELACECDRPGCGETVPVRLADAIEMRSRSLALLAHE